MMSLLRAYPKILILSAEPIEAVRDNRDGLWFAIRLFLLVALIAGLAGLAAIPGAVDELTLAERVNGLARRLEEAIPITPWIFEDVLRELVNAIDQVVAEIQAVEPPLGVRPSRLLRLFGAWLQRLLTWLASWLGMALVTWFFARLMGGEGRLRAHVSVAMLAVAPLALLLLLDLLAGYQDANLFLSYMSWIFELALWVWSAAILARAISLVHHFPLDQAVAAIMLTLFASFLLSALPLLLVFLIILALF